jgi:hypothetical protein
MPGQPFPFPNQPFLSLHVVTQALPVIANTRKATTVVSLFLVGFSAIYSFEECTKPLSMYNKFPNPCVKGILTIVAFKKH